MVSGPAVTTLVHGRRQGRFDAPDSHDLEQIQAIVRDVQDGFTNDASLMNTHLADDAIVARKNAWSTKQDADGGNPPEMNALYIFVKRDGRWLIWRRQNTIVSS